ncbi:hypothetical protein ACWEKT_02555 [Nocardia takedensis]
MAMIRERVAAHAAAGSLDEAHGDVLDRLIHSICRQWAEDARHAYEEQLRLWSYLEEQGTAHSIEKGQRLARLNIRLGRYQDAERRVWARFGDERTDEHADPLPAPVIPLAGTVPALAVVPALTDGKSDEPPPRIHSV